MWIWSICSGSFCEKNATQARETFQKIGTKQGHLAERRSVILRNSFGRSGKIGQAVQLNRLVCQNVRMKSCAKTHKTLRFLDLIAFQIWIPALCSTNQPYHSE